MIYNSFAINSAVLNHEIRLLFTFISTYQPHFTMVHQFLPFHFNHMEMHKNASQFVLRIPVVPIHDRAPFLVVATNNKSQFHLID